MGTKATPVDELDLPEDAEDEIEEWDLGIDDEDEDEGDDPASPELGDQDDPAADAAQVDRAAELPGDEAEPTPQDPPQTDPPAAAGPPDASVAPPAEPETIVPWAFTADGKKVDVPRSQVFEAVVDAATGRKERFVLIPEAELQRTVQPHLADRGAWRQKERGYLEKLAELSTDTHPDLVKAREMTAFLWGLFEKPEDEILSAVEEMRSGRAAWEARQDANAAEAKLRARESVQIDPDPELQRLHEAELEENLQTGLSAHVESLLKRPELAGISPDRAHALLWPLRNEVFFEASEDLPQFGLKKGDIGIDLRYTFDRLKQEADYVRSLLGNATQAKTIEQQNADAVGATRPATAAAPPARPAKSAKRRATVETDDDDPWADVRGLELDD